MLQAQYASPDIAVITGKICLGRRKHVGGVDLSMPSPFLRSARSRRIAEPTKKSKCEHASQEQRGTHDVRNDAWLHRKER